MGGFLFLFEFVPKGGNMKNLMIISIVLVLFALTSNALSTVAVVVKVPEGLVLAADSRTTYPNKKDQYRIATDNARKVFRLAKNCGCVTWGDAFIEGQNVNSLIQEFKAQKKWDPNSSRDIGQILTSFKKFFRNKKGRPSFIIAGYDSDREIKIFEWRPGWKQEKRYFAKVIAGHLWAGQDDVITRLLKGYDGRFDYNPILNVLDSALVSKIDSIQIDTLKHSIQTAIQNELRSLDYIEILGRMTLQDGIDFALFLIQTTVNFQRFTDGIVKDPGTFPGVGGPIDVAVITPKGFEWIQKKELVGEE